jgi:hypothetical protein
MLIDRERDFLCLTPFFDTREAAQELAQRRTTLDGLAYGK